jgi:hypothetical protein
MAGATHAGADYPEPIVMHDEARKRTLERYAVVKKTKTVLNHAIHSACLPSKPASAQSSS